MMKADTDLLFSDLDLYLFGEGNHTRIYEKLGAHPMTRDGVEGTHFAVWAPNANGVSVVGDFNGWNGGADRLRVLGDSGVWAAFIPRAHVGHRYKLEVRTRAGHTLEKADPFGFAFE